MTRDAVVVGAGLAGLVAGLRLQLAGIDTLIIERAPRTGGRCGTFELDGYEFVIGCNDFGTGFASMLEELGVSIAFHHPRARFHFDRHRIELPPDLPTLLKLARRGVGLARIAFGTRHSSTLGELIDGHVQDPLLRDLACLPAYAMMRSPDDVGLSQLGAIFSKELGYGYDRSCTPVGGPQALVDAMVSRFEQLGGVLELGEACRNTTRVDGGLEVETSRRVLRARNVITSEGRWAEYPRQAKAGLEVGLVLLVVRSSRPFPRGLHTLDWFGPDVAGMLRTLDAGSDVERPSFHAFRSDLDERRGCYTMNAFVPMPRGEGSPSAARERAVVDHVRDTLCKLLPGLRAAVAETRFLSPDAYAERFGFRPRPSPRVLPPGHEEPPAWDPSRGVVHIGTSVQPPGEHAGAAALSGWRAAERVLASRKYDPRAGEAHATSRRDHHEHSSDHRFRRHRSI